MLKKLDIAARSLLVVGGVNWLSVAARRLDLVAWATRSRKRPNVAARTIYGTVGAAAVYAIGRAVERQVSPQRLTADAEVRRAMTSEPRSVSPTITAREAALLLERENVGSLPIVEDGRLVGIVTDRDIALRVVGEGRDVDSVTVGEIASRELFTVEPTESLDQALQLMASRQVRRLPVVEQGRLVGMLAQADVARHASEAETAEVVDRISR